MTTYTLGEMAAELAVRLGRGGQNNDMSVVNPISNILFSFLRSAQDELNDTYEAPELRTVWNLQLGAYEDEDPNYLLWTDPKFTNSDTRHYAGDVLIDHVIDPNRITGVHVNVSGIWQPLDEGIDYINDSYQDTDSYPCRYERRSTLEFWPNADQVYDIRVEGYSLLAPFDVYTDVVTLDRQLVFLKAFLKGKAHYGQKDAQLVSDEFGQRFRKIRGYTHGKKRYIPGMPQPVVRVKPRIV